MKHFAIALGSIVVIVGGSFAFFEPDSSMQFYDEDQFPGQDFSDGPEIINKEIPENFTGTLEELLALNRTMECSFVMDDHFGISEGTIYVFGEQVRADFVTKQEGEEQFAVSMIRKDDYVHSWGETAFGPFATSLILEEQQKLDQARMSNFGASTDYECTTWTPVGEIFELPDGIVFEDISERVKSNSKFEVEVN